MTGLELYRRLLAEVDELRHDDPGRAVAAAESARDLVAWLGGGPALDRSAWVTLQVEAWAVLATACRAAGDLARAEEALSVALAFAGRAADDGDADPALRAGLAQRAAYVRRDQGRFDEALRLADEAFALYQVAGATGRAAGAVVDRGLILGRAGRRQEAIATLAAVLDQLAPGSRDALAAVHAVALYLDELAVEEPSAGEEATAWLVLALRSLGRCPDSLWQARTRLLLGRALGRRGAVEAGLAELREAHAAFGRLGAAFDAAVAVLSISEIELARGRAAEVHRLAGRLFPLLRRLRQEGGSVSALALFYRAARARRATVEMAVATRRELERSARRGGHTEP